MKCSICNNTEKNKIVEVKEMMYNTQEVFNYLECSNCGCLQIVNKPDDLGKYYQNDYYSMMPDEDLNWRGKFIQRERNKYAILRKSIFGHLFYKIYPEILYYQIGKTKIDFNSKILDVGTGNGKLLFHLRDIGFKNLRGIDPFLEEDINETSIEINKKSLFDMDIEKFDLIILSHSLEHMANQQEILLKLSQLLSENGKIIINIPLKTEYIWNLYHENWVQIDAPRHFYIHTLKSFQMLVDETDLNIKERIFNSMEFQFWGSEQYQNNIPLLANNSYQVNPENSIFTEKQINQFKQKSKELNRIEQGDQAIFILEKVK